MQMFSFVSLEKHGKPSRERKQSTFHGLYWAGKQLNEKSIMIVNVDNHLVISVFEMILLYHRDQYLSSICRIKYCLPPTDRHCVLRPAEQFSHMKISPKLILIATISNAG